MPPRRRAAAAPANPKPPTTTTRRSKLAKEHEISTDEESQIASAFSLFAHQTLAPSRKSKSATSNDATEPLEYLPTADLRRALIALEIAPSSPADLRELTSIVDEDDSGKITYELFLAVAALQMNRLRHAAPAEQKGKGKGKAREVSGEDVDEEVRKAFALFTGGSGEQITLRDLRRVARDLKEDVPEAVLKDMLREATGGTVGGVGVGEFEGVMRRAGVFG